MIDQPQLPHFGTLLAEGKTKLIYAHPEDENLAYMVNKDQITAGDGVRRNELVGKSRWSTITTANVFRLLNDANIATHFVEQINDVTLLVRRCTMLPIEQVQRRIATGSYLMRAMTHKSGRRISSAWGWLHFQRLSGWHNRDGVSLRPWNEPGLL